MICKEIILRSFEISCIIMSQFIIASSREFSPHFDKSLAANFRSECRDAGQKKRVADWWRVCDQLKRQNYTNPALDYTSYAVKRWLAAAKLDGKAVRVDHK